MVETISGLASKKGGREPRFSKLMKREGTTFLPFYAPSSSRTYAAQRMKQIVYYSRISSLRINVMFQRANMKGTNVGTQV